VIAGAKPLIPGCALLPGHGFASQAPARTLRMMRMVRGQPVQQLAQSATAVAAGQLLFGGEFRERFLGFRVQEKRVVAEAAFSPRRGQDRSFGNGAELHQEITGAGHGQLADESGRALRRGNAAEQDEKLGPIVGVGGSRPGKAARLDARSAAQRVDLQAGVVRKDKPFREPGVVESFLPGVACKGARVLHAGRQTGKVQDPLGGPGVWWGVWWGIASRNFRGGLRLKQTHSQLKLSDFGGIRGGDPNDRQVNTVSQANWRIQRPTPARACS